MKVNEIIDPNLRENWLDTVKGWFKPKQPQPQQPGPGQISVGKIQNVEPQIDINKLMNYLPGPAQILAKQAIAAGIKDVELVQLIAQTAHETGNFKDMVEQGSRSYFNRYEPQFSPQTAKNLGNTQPGDGWRYRGRGHIQLTGRWNYRAAGRALGLPLEQNPDLVNRPDIGAKVTLWFWQTRVQKAVKDFNDVQATTRPINPKLNGLQDRQAKFQHYMKAATQ
jgi:predicted chitinase